MPNDTTTRYGTPRPHPPEPLDEPDFLTDAPPTPPDAGTEKWSTDIPEPSPELIRVLAADSRPHEALESRLRQLSAKWREDANEYPAATDERATFAAAAVRLCANELDTLLSEVSR